MNALDGATDQLKKSVLGGVVFNRGGEFDPSSDSIVRMEAQRLRRRLQEYYEIDGRDDPVAIQFEPGSYVPVFAHASELQARCDMRETRPLNPQTVAVVPLQNQSADPEQDYFCDGITDDIIYALSRIPGLNVIAHASVFACKGVAQVLGTSAAGGRHSGGRDRPQIREPIGKSSQRCSTP